MGGSQGFASQASHDGSNVYGGGGGEQQPEVALKPYQFLMVNVLRCVFVWVWVCIGVCRWVGG